MSDQTVRAAIKARLDAYGPAMGRVHDYERMGADVKDFLSAYQDPATKKIFGWEITRRRVRVQKVTMTKWKLVHHYVVRGFYGLSDAAGTEKIFNALVDQVVLDFTRTKLPGTQGEQLPEATVEPWMLGAVLCHRAEIVLPEVAEIVEQLPEEGETILTGIGLEYYLKPGDDAPDAADDLTFNNQE